MKTKETEAMWKAFHALEAAVKTAYTTGNLYDVCQCREVEDAISGLASDIRTAIAEEYSGLDNYSSEGRYIGPVAHENGWTP